MEMCISNLLEPGETVVVGASQLLRACWERASQAAVPCAVQGCGALPCGSRRPPAAPLRAPPRAGNNGIWGSRVCDMAQRFGAKVRAAGLCCSCWIDGRKQPIGFCAGCCVQCTTGCPAHSLSAPALCHPSKHHCSMSQVVNLETPAGTSFSLDTLKKAVETHKPAVLFLVQVRGWLAALLCSCAASRPPLLGRLAWPSPAPCRRRRRAVAGL